MRVFFFFVLLCSPATGWLVVSADNLTFMRKSFGDEYSSQESKHGNARWGEEDFLENLR